MLPVRLELKNFLAYRETAIVSFDGIHLACLSGPNGAGKSSLLDAITWVLWGEARTGSNRRTDELIHFNEPDMLVQLDFAHEGELYRVVRKRARKGAGTTTLDLYARLEDGSWNPIGEATVKGTQTRIVDLLGLDYETFTHSAFLQQGKADSFAQLGPGDRKNTLAQILRLDRFQAYEKAARDQAKAAEIQIGAFTGQLADIEDQLSREPEMVAALREAGERHAAASAASAEADARLREMEHVPQATKEARNAVSATEMRLKNAQLQLQDAERRVREAEREVSEREAALARRAEVQAGHHEYQEARSQNSVLNEKFERFAQVREQIRDLDAEISKRRAAVEAQAGKLDVQIASAGKVIQMADPDAYAQARAAAAERDETDAALNTAKEQMGALEQERSALLGEKKSLEVETDKLRERWRKLAEVDTSTCPLCGQPLDAEHRQRTLSDIQAEGNGLKTRVSACDDRLEAIKPEMKALTEARQRHETNLKRLQPIAQSLALYESRARDAQAAANERDEYTAQRAALLADLEAGGYKADLTARMAELVAERDALGYDQAAHTDSKRRLSDLERFEQEYQQLQQAEAALPGAQRALETARQNLTLFQSMVENETVAQADAKARLAELMGLHEEFLKRQQTADDLRRKERQADNDRVSRQQALSALDGLRARRDDLTEKLAVQRERRGVHEELATAFGKNGIPAMLIETAIPEIEEDANDLLWKMTGGRMAVRLVTQREGRSTSAPIETLEIVVRDELGERLHDTFSGGESFRVNFALRVALSQLLARRAGAHLRALFLDEGFGTQDDEGRARLVEAITAVQDRFDLILVITHIEELRDSFPVHLLVSKTEAGSRVVIR